MCVQLGREVILESLDSTSGKIFKNNAFYDYILLAMGGPLIVLIFMIVISILANFYTERGKWDFRKFGEQFLIIM